MLAVCFNAVVLGIDFHLRHRVVELHVLLANLAAVLDGFDALLEPVGGDGAAADGGGGDKEDGGRGDEGCEHRAGDYGLYGWDGGIWITLLLLVMSMRRVKNLPFVSRR